MPVLVGDLAEDLQALLGVGVHAARALEQRLDDDARELVRVLCGDGAEFRCPQGDLGLRRVVPRGLRAEDLRREQVAPHRVHAAVGVGDGHAVEGVAVVATEDGEEPRPLGAPDSPLELQHHLHRDLDRDRAGVGEEDLLQAVGGELDERAAERDRGVVGQPAEHHVAEAVDLVADRLVQPRVAVAVDRRPPRAHAVDDLDGVSGQAGGGERRRAPEAPTTIRTGAGSVIEV
jgi:hypothetical protein